MAKKKLSLQADQGDNISLIGISCHLKSYRLSFLLNTALYFKFKRIDDFQIPAPGDPLMLQFPFFKFDHPDLQNHFCLIGNHHPQGKLLPALKQVDYFLMAKNPLEMANMEYFLKKIRGIPQVLAAYEIVPAKTKNIEMILTEMELHLLAYEKSKK